MKRRYLYTLMFGVPAFLFSGILAVLLTGAIAGTLWIFVLGDNAWPSSVHRSLLLLVLAAFSLVWLALLAAAYRWGKRQESSAVLNRNHLFLAMGSTAGLLLVAFLHQLSTGNLGRKPDAIVCADFCTSRGLYASRLPPDGTCRCLASDGRDSLVSPVQHLREESR